MPALSGIWAALTFAWTYRKDLMELGHALTGLYRTIALKIDKAKIDKKVDDAQKTHNPDAIEHGVSGQ